MKKVLRNTKINKLSALLFAIVMVFTMTLFGCKTEPPPADYTPNEVFPKEFIGLTQGKKVYATSIGQSMDILTFERSISAVEEIDCVIDPLLEVENVDNGSVVFAVVGCSIKSLTANGLTKESELKRIQRFISAYNESKITLVCWHLGGVARRGATSDSIIQTAFGNCSLAIFKADGNVDLKLSDWANSGSVPYCQFDSSIPLILRYLAGANNV